MPWTRSHALCSLAALGVAFGAPAAEVAVAAKVTASDAGPYDVAATSLDMLPGLVAVGVRGRDDGGNNRGAVYTFERSGAQWLQGQKITPFGPVEHEEFGDSLSLSGSWLAVGARKSQRGATPAGSAWVFQSNGASFIEQIRLESPTPVAQGAFGCAVDVVDGASVSTLVVGAQRELSGSVAAGAVHVFDRVEGGEWLATARLVAPGVPTENDEFGHTVATDGSRLYVGAPGDDSAAVNAGAVYIFVRVGTAWALEAKLISPSPQALAEFGGAVAIDGSRLVVGTYRESDALPQCGRAHVFVRGASGWAHEQSLISPTPTSGGEFGCSVAIEGEAIVVGAQRERRADGTLCGNAHMFRRNASSGWVSVATGRSVASQSDELGGTSVGIAASVVAFGAPLRTESQAYQGACFIADWSADCDGDLIPDAAELAAGAADCNQNSIPDACDIAAGAPDDDANGIPDECEQVPCPADVVIDGVVNGIDLAAVLSTWGTDAGAFPTADYNHDGIVDGLDLAGILSGWGTCP